MVELSLPLIYFYNLGYYEIFNQQNSFIAGENIFVNSALPLVKKASKDWLLMILAGSHHIFQRSIINRL